jgi:hypothetical protein
VGRADPGVAAAARHARPRGRHLHRRPGGLDERVRHPARRRRSAGRTGAIGYLHDLRDGQTWYRNEVAEPSTVDPAIRGAYAVSAWGLPVARYRLDQDGASPILWPAAGRRSGRRRSTPAASLSSTGEVLDLTGPMPSCAKIPLARS